MIDTIEKKAMEIARKHAIIIDKECQMVCEKFKCNPEDLIIEYHENTKVKINVKGSYFEITNTFIF